MCVHPWRVLTLLVTLAAVSLGPRVIPSWAESARAQDTAAKPAAAKSGPDQTIRALVAQLGDDAFEMRQAAQKRLAEIGEPALELLRKAAKGSPDAEVRARAQRLILEIGHQHFRTLLKDKRWGALVDPEFDCTFRVDQDQLHVKIPPKPHILSAEIGGTNAPRVLREVEGDFRAEVTVLGAIPADARSLVPGRWPYYGAGLLVWQDERNYLRLDRARMYYIPAKKWRCYVGWEQRQNGQMARGGKWEEGPLAEDKPASFRLERKGNEFTASYSQDGKEWKRLPPIEANLAKKLSVGIAAMQNTPAGYEVTFKGLKVTAPNKKE